MSVFYSKFPIVLDSTHAVLHDCSSEAEGLMIGRWRGFFKLEDSSFIDDMHASLRAMEKHNCVAIISDHSGLQVVTDDVLDWLHANWYPTAKKHGLLLEASLDAQNATASMSLNRMLDDAKTGDIQTPKFESYIEAYLFAKRFLKRVK